MIRIAVCDDEEIYLEMIQKLIKNLELSYKTRISVNTYKNGYKLLEAMASKRFHIFLIDIEMPDIDGMALSQKINKIRPNSIIIFVTNFVDYWQKGYEVRAFRYILKSQLRRELARCINDAVKELISSASPSYTIKVFGEEIPIPISEILYFTVKKRMITACTSTKSYCFYNTLEAIEEDLGMWGFVRCHKGYLVNCSQIASLKYNTITLKNKLQLPLSRIHSKETRKVFFMINS